MKIKITAIILVLVGISGFCGESYGCNTQPDGVSIVEPWSTVTGVIVTFDGSDSNDTDDYGFGGGLGSSGITKFEWDFDYIDSFIVDYTETINDHSDNEFDGKTTHMYYSGGTKMVMLRITDDDAQWALSDMIHCYIEVQHVIYVKANASGSNNGDTWANAYNYLQDALGEAVSGDEIWVAEGAYYPDEGSGHYDNLETEHFGLKNGVAVYGGFIGTETSRNQRNWAANLTILSGDIQQTSGDDTDNSYNVVVGAAGATLDGFTITKGYADHASIAQYKCGAGMYNSSCSPTVRNCIFNSNFASNTGGGMYNYSSSPSIINCGFGGNSSTSGGAGLSNNSSSPTITNCTFKDNSASGAGISLYNAASSNPIFANCIIWGDETYEVVNSSSSPSFRCCDIKGCGGSTWNTNYGTNLNGNKDTDPLFLDVSPDNFELNTDSPCIDAGDDTYVPTNVTEALGGQNRKWGDTVDMGADEVYRNPWREVTGNYNISQVLPDPFTIIDKIGGTYISQEGCLALPFGTFVSGKERNYHKVKVTFTGTGTCKISIGHYGDDNPNTTATTYNLHTLLTQIISDEEITFVSPYRGEDCSWLFIYKTENINISSIEYTYLEGKDTLYGHTAQIFEFADRDLPYRIMFPKNYDRSQEYPLVLNVHGSDSLDDNTIQGTNNYGNMQMVILARYLFTHHLNNTNLECISIVPQIPDEDDLTIPAPYYPNGSLGAKTSPEHPDRPMVNENGWYNQACLALINNLIENNAVKIDPDRVYFTGFSYGGKACWEFLKSDPELFAGALCCAGWPIGAAYSNPVPSLSVELAIEVDRYKHIPTWIFAGYGDPMKLGSLAVYEEITFQGGTSINTVFGSDQQNPIDHVSSAELTWNNSDHNIEWLFEQSLSNRPTLNIIIHASAEGGTYISPNGDTNGDTIVEPHDNQAYTISADTGNDTELFVDDAFIGYNQTNYTFTDVTYRHKINVKLFRKTIHSSAENGATINPSGDTFITHINTDQEYTITAPSGRTTELYIDGQLDSVLFAGTNYYTFYDVTENHTIEVKTSDAYNQRTSQQYRTIQEAIDDAATDDVIKIFEGVYTNIDFNGKAITVQSTNPEDPGVVADTILQGYAIIVQFVNDEGPSSVLSGLTIENGNPGIKCGDGTKTGNPTIRKCVIKENNCGIECYGSAPKIINNIICDNVATPMIGLELKPHSQIL